MKDPLATIEARAQVRQAELRTAPAEPPPAPAEPPPADATQTETVEQLLSLGLSRAHKYGPSEIIQMAEAASRTLRNLQRLSAPTSEPTLPLVQYDQGQAGGARDQATYHVNIGAAKASFSRLIAAMLDGDVVVICRDGDPIARLIPYERAFPKPDTEC